MIYLSLGSNIGDKERNLTRALELLKETPGIELIKVSSIYETEPWGRAEQESFLNLVAQVDTKIDPFDLLHICQSIEELLGRTRTAHWGPRIIDIDILLYDDLSIQSEELTIPHPYMEDREFVLAPLCEIEEAMILPSGKPVSEVKIEGKITKL